MASTSRNRSSTSVSFSSTGTVSFGIAHSNSSNETDDAELIDGLDIDQAIEATMSEEPNNKDVSDADSLILEKSTGSSDGTCSKETTGSKIGAFIDKAKSKTKKLVSRKDKSEHINTAAEEKEHFKNKVNEEIFTASILTKRSISVDVINAIDPLETPVELEASSGFFVSASRTWNKLPFLQYRTVSLGGLIAVTMLNSGFLIGVLWGLYISFVSFLFLFVSEPKENKQNKDELNIISENDVDVAFEVITKEEGTALGVGDGVIYKGWMNELKIRYGPSGYHVNNTQTVLVRLEGSTLRISRPSKAVLKHAFHDDPTLRHTCPSMIAQSIYDLTHAKVCLRPRRLAKRRWWSRKYPIQIKFKSKRSTVAEVGLVREGLPRSLSAHPVPGGGETMVNSALSEPNLEELDAGYSAESESSDEEDVTSLSATTDSRFSRSNSAGDISSMQKSLSGGKKKKECIHLFVRAAREKERWFHLLREASAKGRLTLKRRDRTSSHIQRSINSCGTHDVDSSDNTTKQDVANIFEYFLYRRNHFHFAKQIFDLLGSGLPEPEPASTVSMDLGSIKWCPGVLQENSELIESVNVVASRIFFDFCRDQFWINAIKNKIQSKLATIHLPYFIETLELSDLNLGTIAPQISGLYSPKVDEWGVWMDFELSYHGGIRLTLQTSVNLLKLKSGVNQVETTRKVSKWNCSGGGSRYSDEELPESPESSPDEDFGAKVNEKETTKERTGKKLLSFVERAAQSSLFQKAAKMPRLAKLMEEVSSTPLLLNVEVEMLEGIMTVNIPPPPSDRLWYSFRKVPKVSIKAVPQVGDRSVDVSTVSDWIESKLRLLIEKNLVCPNMDDIVLPAMSGNSLLHSGYNT